MSETQHPVVTKACPLCGEQILAVAIKCKHCGSDLATGGKPAAASSDTLGLLLTVIPFVGTGLCWLWVANSPLLTASSNLGTVMAIVVLGCAVLAALDVNALRLGTKDGPGPKENGPVATFVAVGLLWLFVYPWYMFKRASYGAKRLGAAAAVGTLLFIASAGILYGAIEQKSAEVRQLLGQ